MAATEIATGKQKRYDLLRARRLGHEAAARIVGLEKSAVDWGKVRNVMLGAPGPAAPPLPPGAPKPPIDWAGGAKRLFVGEPGKFKDQLQKGQLLGHGGMLRDAIVPKSVVGGLFNYGLPAMQLASTWKDTPPEQRGSAVGGTLGNIAGGLLGSPLGAVGVIGGSLLGSHLGQSVGHTFDRTPA